MSLITLFQLEGGIDEHLFSKSIHASHHVNSWQYHVNKADFVHPFYGYLEWVQSFSACWISNGTIGRKVKIFV